MIGGASSACLYSAFSLILSPSLSFWRDFSTPLAARSYTEASSWAYPVFSVSFLRVTAPP